MKISYDKTVDALNVTIRKGKVAKTLEIAPEVMLDLDDQGKPLYLEIIGASEKIGLKELQKITIGSTDVPFLSSPLAR